MTVQEILLNYRDALRSIIPAVEHIGLAWKDSEAYDDWDDVASALYKALVAEVLKWGLQKDRREEFNLLPYDMLVSNFESFDFIEVRPHESHGQGYAFSRFCSDSKPFDTVESIDMSSCRQISYRHSLDKVDFLLALRSGGETMTISQVDL